MKRLIKRLFNLCDHKYDKIKTFKVNHHLFDEDIPIMIEYVEVYRCWKCGKFKKKRFTLS